MQRFDYHRPASVNEATALLGAGGERAVLAGGHTLIPAMKARLRAPDALVDIGRIPGLDAITREGDRLWIGSTARHAVVETSEVVRDAIPSLARLAAGIGDPQVRAAGTLGGSVANNDPAADYPAAVLALDGLVETDRGTHAADDFFQGMFATALAEGEIITRIGFRVPAAGAYAKFRHPASRYAVVGVYAARHAAGHRVAVTGAGYGVFRWSDAETALDSGAPLDALALDPSDLNGDLHASAEYRANLAGVMLRRAVAEMT